MGGRNISTRVESNRGGVRVEINGNAKSKTAPGVGVGRAADQQELLGGPPPEPDEEGWVVENIISRWCRCAGAG